MKMIRSLMSVAAVALAMICMPAVAQDQPVPESFSLRIELDVTTVDADIACGAAVELLQSRGLELDQALHVLHDPEPADADGVHVLSTALCVATLLLENIAPAPTPEATVTAVRIAPKSPPDAPPEGVPGLAAARDPEPEYCSFRLFGLCMIPRLPEVQQPAESAVLAMAPQ